jgi:hypothetical protein
VNCFFPAEQHASSSSDHVDVNPVELKRLQELLDAGMIQPAEFERRKALLKSTGVLTRTQSSPGQASSSRRTDFEPVAIQRPQATSSASEIASSSTQSSSSDEKFDEEAAEEAEDVMEGMIVVFFADGTPRYNDMTAYALRTFIDSTPRILVGLLTKDEKTAEEILGTLAPSQKHRVLPKLTSQTPHFDNWNPTQYKLDIAQYAEAFETIFWFDSDTITFGDMTEFLTAFAASDAKFYMTPDHVNSDPTFCKNWVANLGALCVVPQACLMGFKTDVIAHFFSIWEAIWKHWITPTPFANFRDPNPTFEGSEFCIEQYALAQSLVYKHDIDWSKQVMWFKRQSIAVPKNGNAPIDTIPKRVTSATPILKLIAAHPQHLVDIKELRSQPLPPKTKTRLSNSILISEHYDYIDRFANLYHCYNHSYVRVKIWFEQFTAYGPQK